MGQLIIFASKTHLVNPFDKRPNIPGTEAPKTFRIPISLIRLSAVKEAKPNIPKHEMNRVLGELTEFEIFNSGMQSRFSESGESYRISAGSDVSDAIDPVTGKLFSAGHVFCKAQTDESQINTDKDQPPTDG